MYDDLEAIRTAVFKRGFNFMDDSGTESARVDDWINEAYHELCEENDWPFLQTTVSGTAPLALTRARNVESVYDTTDEYPLTPTTLKWVNENYGDPTTDGLPIYWYSVTSATDTITVKTAPAPSGKTINVVFYQHPADLAVDADIPVVPARWRRLIFLGAIRRAYEDNDQSEQAVAVEAERSAGLEKMERFLLNQAPPSIISTEPGFFT